MNEFWVKLIGTHEQPCPENYGRTYVDSRMSMSGIHCGDHMILYAVGAHRRIFAIAQVTSEAYPSGDPAWPNRVNIDCQVELPVSQGVPITNINTPNNLIGRIQRGHSYFRLSQAEYEQAVALLQAAAGHQEAVPN
jgi:hypothetical protein